MMNDRVGPRDALPENTTATNPRGCDDDPAVMARDLIRRLYIDLDAVSVFLEIEFPGFGGEMRVERYCHQRRTKTIGGISISCPDVSIRDAVAVRAETALRALGWDVDRTASSEAEWHSPVRADHLSAHQRLPIYGHVRKAVTAHENGHDAPGEILSNQLALLMSAL